MLQAELKRIGTGIAIDAMLGLRTTQLIKSNHLHLLALEFHRYRYLRLQQLHCRPSPFLHLPGRRGSVGRSRSGSRGRISENQQDCQHLTSLSCRTGTQLLALKSAREVQRRPGIRFLFVSRAMAESGEGDKGAAGSTAHKYTNRLIKEQSPYLLQHAHNPVDWYPWGEEAFSKARAEDKPIFLSVGYSTCHWCHVMEVESFENEEVAKVMNDWFVNIKVDREERPDVDKVYMTYVQATQGGGGWPMSVFLTPELKPIVGGTYFPPDDRYGRPGIKSVLKRVKEAWDLGRDSLRETGDQVIQQLAGLTSTRGSTSEMSEGSTLQAVQLCVQQLTKDFDSKLGGFGGPPKFPRPVELKAVLQHYKHLGVSGKEGAAAKVLEMALFTIRSMAYGGIHDHVGGGFHRYSVDEYWHVPHFEKMLYDQGQLVNVFLDAFAITRDIQYASSARDVLDYIKRDMTDSEGGIYSAEDADSAESAGATRKKEGAFYVWTRQEIELILGEERAKLFCAHYYVKPGGNCDLSRTSDPHREFAGKNVLIQRQSLAETATKFGKSAEEIAELLGSCRRDLHARRSARPRPLLDDKVIVAWNGLTISAFARASKVLATEPNNAQFYFPVTPRKAQDYLADALKAASYIKKKLYDGETGKLRRSFRVQQSAAPGFLEDYAFLIAGLLDLYEAGGGASSLCWAIELQKKQDELFWDSSCGAYFSTAGDDPSILFMVKEDYDGAEPSGNSVAAINLLRLSAFASGDQSDQYRRRAERLLAALESRIRDVAVAVPLLCVAFDSFHTSSKRQIIISGERLADNTSALLAVAHSLFDPEKTIIHIDPNDPDDVATWGKINPTALAMVQSGRKDTAVAYVCQNFSCKAPTSDPEALEQILRQPMGGPEVTTFNLASSGLSK